MRFVNIETARLQLIGLTPDDMSIIFQEFSKDELMKFLGHRSQEDYLKEEHKQKNGYASYNRTFLLFLLKDKETELTIGRCALHNWNKDHSRAEIGYSMEEESFRRKGLMTEALGAVIDYGFNHLKLNRIEALVGETNLPSLKLMERYKFIKEGVLRGHYFIEGNYVDSVMFSRLHEDFTLEE